MRKFKGHVLQPVLELAEKVLERKLPKHWSVRSRCIPDAEKHLQKVSQALVGLERRFESKAAAKAMILDGKVRPTMIGSALEGSWKRSWEHCKRKWSGALHEKELSSLARRWVNWVISPVDKWNTDAVLM